MPGVRLGEVSRSLLVCTSLLPTFVLLRVADARQGVSGSTAFDAVRNTIRTARNPRDGAEMVFVPSGAFKMGSSDADISAVASADPRSEVSLMASEKPQRLVNLDDYWIYRTEVTVAQYRRFCDATRRPMPRPPDWGWKDDHPMVNVTWHDASAYAAWAGAALPTEAEWEKAARGTDGRRFIWGDAWPPPSKSGNFADEAMARKYRRWQLVPNYSDGFIETAPVGSFPVGASPYGALDMIGNVWEWCADWFDPAYYVRAPADNPMGPTTGKYRSLRGGCWSNFDADFLRPSKRNRKLPDDSDDKTGFRCIVRRKTVE